MRGQFNSIGLFWNACFARVYFLFSKLEHVCRTVGVASSGVFSDAMRAFSIHSIIRRHGQFRFTHPDSPHALKYNL